MTPRWSSSRTRPPEHRYLVRVGAVSRRLRAAGASTCARPRPKPTRGRHCSSASSARRVATRCTSAPTKTVDLAGIRSTPSSKALGISDQALCQAYGRPGDHAPIELLAGRPRRRVPACARTRARCGRGRDDPAGSSRSAPRPASRAPRRRARDHSLFAILLHHGLPRVPLRPPLRAGHRRSRFLHDAILVIGAFALTYEEFSLTTVAAHPDRHRLLDERHDRRLRPDPRERRAACGTEVRQRRQPSRSTRRCRAPSAPPRRCSSSRWRCTSSAPA